MAQRFCCCVFHTVYFSFECKGNSSFKWTWNKEKFNIMLHLGVDVKSAGSRWRNTLRECGDSSYVCWQQTTAKMLWEQKLCMMLGNACDYKQENMTSSMLYGGSEFLFHCHSDDGTQIKKKTGEKLEFTAQVIKPPVLCRLSAENIWSQCALRSLMDYCRMSL